MTEGFEPSDDLQRAAKPARRRRFVPQFGLRTILLAGVVFSLLFGWYGRHIYRVRQERAAVERLLQVGASLTIRMPDASVDHLSTLPPAKSLLAAPWIEPTIYATAQIDSANGAKDAHVADVATLMGVETVFLHGPGFGDASIEPLGRIESLRSLTLGRTAVSAQGLSRLANREQIVSFSGVYDTGDAFDGEPTLPNLEEIHFLAIDVTQKRMASVARHEKLGVLTIALPRSIEQGAYAELATAKSLRRLNVMNRFGQVPADRVTDEDFAAFAKISTLESLSLAAREVTDDGVAALARLPRLRELGGPFPHVTDAGVAKLVERKRLESLDLRGWKITDAALDSLRSLPLLDELKVDESVSVQAVGRFAAERPACVVQLFRDDGVLTLNGPAATAPTPEASP